MTRAQLSALLIAITLAASGPAAHADVEYRIDLAERASHLAVVDMTVCDAPAPLELAMPLWTPGAYEVRTWGRNVRLSGAVDETGRPLDARRTGPSTFRVEGQRAGATVHLRYQVYAALLSDDASQIDSRHAYLNGTSIFLLARGEEKSAQRVRIAAPTGWRVASALARDGEALTAEGYEALIDAPIEVGNFALAEVQAAGRSYQIAIDGAREVPERLRRDLAKIVSAEVAIAGAPPYSRYLLLIHLADGLGRVAALEHAASTSILVPRRSLTSDQAYDELVYVIAHELFHAWNARLLRPAELVPYDLLQPERSRSLWITEGMTEYFAHRVMLASGLWSKERYLAHVDDEAARAVEDARRGLTLEEDSELTWQPPDDAADDPDAYYARGHLVALTLDASIRGATDGKRSLADVLRALLAESARRGGVLAIDGHVLARAISEIAGNAVGAEVADFTTRPHEPLRLGSALAGLGLALEIDDLPPHPAAGFSAALEEDALRVEQVAPGGAADQAGLRAGDRVVLVDGKPPTRAWLSGLRDRAPGAAIVMEVLRGARRLELALGLAVERPIRCRLRELPARAEVTKLRDAWLSPRGR